MYSIVIFRGESIMRGWMYSIQAKYLKPVKNRKISLRLNGDCDKSVFRNNKSDSLLFILNLVY